MSTSKAKPTVTGEPPPGKTAKLIITKEHVAVLDPPVLLLQPLLEYTARSYEPGGPTGYREVMVPTTLCEFDRKGRLVFPAGLARRAVHLLREHGWKVQVDDQRPRDRRLTIAPAVLDDLEWQEHELLEAIIREPLGQIEVRRFDDVIAKCKLLSRAFPGRASPSPWAAIGPCSSSGAAWKKSCPVSVSAWPSDSGSVVPITGW